MIYFSFGSCIRSADLPPKQLQAFIETFRLIKQKILWKFENTIIPNMPSNVMIRPWLPQNEVLAHKNVKLFLTHGGKKYLRLNVVRNQTKNIPIGIDLTSQAFSVHKRVFILRFQWFSFQFIRINFEMQSDV